jgi:hypothetical protein
MFVLESDVISNDTVLLHGHVENLDFDNAIFANTESEVTFFDEKTFKTNLTINGTASFDGFVNDFNFTQFCKFAWGEVRHKNLTLDGTKQLLVAQIGSMCISGDAFFVRGPDVAHLNGLGVQTINDEAWFGDEDSVLTGSLELGDVTFTTDVTVGVSTKVSSVNCHNVAMLLPGFRRQHQPDPSPRELLQQVERPKRHRYVHLRRRSDFRK